MITPTETIVIPPKEGKSANGIWLKHLTISAPSLTASCEVVAVLVPFSTTTGEMFDEKAVIMVLNDVLTKAEADPQLANCCQVIFAEIDRQAKMQGII